MRELFQFTVHPAELILRGTLIYLGLVVVLRYLLRRDVGAMGMPDILFIVLVADAAQNAMAGEYRSIADGTILLGTLIFWNVALDWVAYRNSAFRRLIEPPPLPLIRDGKWIRKNLKSEWITVDEVETRLREQGVEKVAEVRLATLEADGELSVLKVGSNAANPRRRRRFLG